MEEYFCWIFQDSIPQVAWRDWIKSLKFLIGAAGYLQITILKRYRYCSLLGDVFILRYLIEPNRNPDRMAVLNREPLRVWWSHPLLTRWERCAGLAWRLMSLYANWQEWKGVLGSHVFSNACVTTLHLIKPAVLVKAKNAKKHLSQQLKEDHLVD